MNFDLKVDLKKRIDKWIVDNAAADMWDELVSDDLALHMASAAEAAFDAAQSGARFQRKESES